MQTLSGGWQPWPTVFEVGKLQQRAAELQAEQQKPDFWKDQVRAQAASRELADISADVEFLTTTQARCAELRELAAVAESEGDPAVLQDIEKELKQLAAVIQGREKAAQFSGPHDGSGAIMTIQAGAGGTDAQDWAQMLERMYVRFAEQRGWKTHMLERQPGEEAGIKHVTFEITGRYAYGLLKSEHGVHRLVRQSPFNADHLRQTSFARVEVLPKLEPREVPDINPNDLEVDTFRSGGAGGQHVNKTSSAVRIKHIPTGITVKVDQERSQGQNRAMAMAVLQAKLQKLVEEQQAATIKDLKGETKEAAWGNQIRSYVLHPYKLVKDHRTQQEDTNAEGVLDGDLSAFIDVI